MEGLAEPSVYPSVRRDKPGLAPEQLLTNAAARLKEGVTTQNSPHKQRLWLGAPFRYGEQSILCSGAGPLFVNPTFRFAEA